MGSAARIVPANVTVNGRSSVRRAAAVRPARCARCRPCVDEQRPEVLVPRGQEREHRRARRSRARERDDDPPEEAPVAVPVEAGRFLEILRQREERLAEQERAEPGREERDDQALVRVDPAEIRDGRVVGDDRDLERDHQRREEEHEDRALQREVEEREHVRGQVAVAICPSVMKNTTMKLFTRYSDMLPCVPRVRVVAPLRVRREERRRAGRRVASRSATSSRPSCTRGAG